MPVTEHWKRISTELVINGQGSSVSVTYIGLADASFDAEANPVTGEISGTGYARIPVSWSSFVTDMTNSDVATWQVSGAWPDVRYVFISDSSQGGQVMMYDLVTDVDTDDGDVISIAVGDLIIT